MKRTEFIRHVVERSEERLSLLQSKGAAYSGDADAFANFKKNAERLGLTPFQIWAVYCAKHLDAIFTAIRTNPQHPIDRSEGLQGRIDDAINYLELLSGLVAEMPSCEVTQTVMPDTRAIADHIVVLLGGNGLSQLQQTALIIEYLDLIYGPRKFAL